MDGHLELQRSFTTNNIFFKWFQNQSTYICMFVWVCAFLSVCVCEMCHVCISYFECACVVIKVVSFSQFRSAAVLHLLTTPQSLGRESKSVE